MFRFMFRVLAITSLALAVMFVIIDATRSVGVSALEYTAVRSSWQNFLPDTLDQTMTWLSATVHPFLVDPIFETVLEWPSFLIFGLLSLIFYIFGYRRERRTRNLGGR